MTYAIIDFPSNLGLRAKGVERLPEALREARLPERLGARDTAVAEPPATNDKPRDEQSLLLNGPALHEALDDLANAVSQVVAMGEIPVVLAGDCSVMLGGLLGLRRAAANKGDGGRFGLVFVDGHVDFYEPEASPTGEVADMDLALATGRGPRVLTKLDARAPEPGLVRDDDVVAIGARDRDERHRAGSQPIEETGIHLHELEDVHARGMEDISRNAVETMGRPGLRGFWLHLDADVLDDAVMPAVDYRQPGGLSPEELVTLLRTVVRSDGFMGMSVAIYNPTLDPDRSSARVLSDCLEEGLQVA